MKFFKLLFLSLAIATFSGCGNDDDNGPEIAADLVGTWTAEDLDYSGNSVTEIQGQTIEATFVGEALNIDFTLTFSEDPNEIISDGSYDIELTTTVAGQSNTQIFEDLEFLESGTYVRNGNMLTVTQGQETSVAIIEELTNNSLRLKIDDVQEQSQGGTTISITTTIIAIFSR